MAINGSKQQDLVLVTVVSYYQRLYIAHLFPRPPSKIATRKHSANSWETHHLIFRSSLATWLGPPRAHTSRPRPHLRAAMLFLNRAPIAHHLPVRRAPPSAPSTVLAPRREKFARHPHFPIHSNDMPRPLHAAPPNRPWISADAAHATSPSAHRAQAGRVEPTQKAAQFLGQHPRFAVKQQNGQQQPVVNDAFRPHADRSRPKHRFSERTEGTTG
jgi:hypothetical protein